MTVRSHSFRRPTSDTGPISYATRPRPRTNPDPGRISYAPERFRRADAGPGRISYATGPVQCVAVRSAMAALRACR